MNAMKVGYNAMYCECHAIRCYGSRNTGRYALQHEAMRPAAGCHSPRKKTFTK